MAGIGDGVAVVCLDDEICVVITIGEYNALRDSPGIRAFPGTKNWFNNTNRYLRTVTGHMDTFFLCDINKVKTEHSLNAQRDQQSLIEAQLLTISVLPVHCKYRWVVSCNSHHLNCLREKGMMGI
jgi:hypothetical protein